MYDRYSSSKVERTGVNPFSRQLAQGPPRLPRRSTMRSSGIRGKETNTVHGVGRPDSEEAIRWIISSRLISPCNIPRCRVFEIVCSCFLPLANERESG